MGDLAAEVRKWLSDEGYPTEFRTANVFREAGFHVRQGLHARDQHGEAPREIDALADLTLHTGEHYLRVCHIVECKFSKSKPWVIFSDPGFSIAPSACIAQTIGSHLGGCLLWIDAGKRPLHRLDIFQVPKRAGFGGRQAFAKGNDSFYAAISAATQLSVSYMKRYDHEERQKGILPRAAVIAFPLIVVDAPLFEAYFSNEKDDVVLEQIPHIRCHWRGSAAWPLHATVEVVALSHLKPLVEARLVDSKLLLSEMEATCFAAGTLDALQISSGSRGVVGLHQLLSELSSK